MAFKPMCQKCGSWHWPTEDCAKPQHTDERGRFCSFNTVCQRNCTPKERERCAWWANAKDETPQLPLELTPLVSHAKDRDGK